MDEIQQTTRQNPSTLVPPTFTSLTQQPVPNGKTSWIYVILITILIGVAGYFGFHNYQLRQQLTKVQPTSSAIVEDNSLSQKPTSSDTTTPLLGHYQNDKFGFKINHPQDWNITAKEYDIQADQREYQRKCSSGELDGCGGSRWPDYRVELYNQNSQHYLNVDIHVIPVAENLGGKEYQGFTYILYRTNYNKNPEEAPKYYVSESIDKQIENTLTFYSPPQPLGCLWLPDFVSVDVNRVGIDKSTYNHGSGYYFNKTKKSCQNTELYYGDHPNIPFNSLDDCQKSCVGR